MPRDHAVYTILRQLVSRQYLDGVEALRIDIRQFDKRSVRLNRYLRFDIFIIVVFFFNTWAENLELNLRVRPIM